jgi:hypothetical protein
VALNDLESSVDFTFAFAVVHETPSAERFFAETARAMKKGASLLLAEPAGHVGAVEFAGELSAAAANGLKVVGRLSIKRCVAEFLEKE